MASVDLKVGGVALATIGLYTLVANVIPQVQSEVPEVLAFGADVSADELVAAGEGLFTGAGGCTTCHAESPGARAPNLLTDYRGQGSIGARCGTRVSGVACKSYLYQALTAPTEHLVDEFPPIMPAANRTMTEAQIWSMIAFLESNGGTVTVTGADIPPEGAPAEGGAAPGAAGAAALGGAPSNLIASTDAAEIVLQNCSMCHLVGTAGMAMGPTLNGVGARIGADGIRSSILDPAAAASPGFEPLQQIMPKDFGSRMTATQLESVVRYLSELP